MGPEPSWLLDAEETDVPAEPEEPGPPVGPPTPPADSTPVEADEPTGPAEPETTVIAPAVMPRAPRKQEKSTPADQPSRAEAEASAPPRRTHPWLWGAIPFVLLLATGIIAWFGTTQTLNGLATWEAIRTQQPPLLPARWAMTVWWLALPLIGIFLIYGTLPTGRNVTRIKTTGPLISVALVGTGLWIFAQHWQWQEIALISMLIATIAILASYLLVALGPAVTNIRQRFLAVFPLSAALVYSLLLSVLSWQSYSSQPFGERGSSVLFALLLVIIAAVFAFFMRDGLFALVLAVWFAGVVHQQWGEDAVISLVAAVTLLFSAALAVLGTILATESPRPSLTTSVESARGRTSFFRKKQDPPANDLP